VPGSVRAVVEFAEIAVRQEAERFIAFLHDRSERADELAGQRASVTMSKESYWATPDEAEQLNAAVTALTEPFLARMTDPSLRPAGARLMRWFATSHPDLAVPAAPGADSSTSEKEA